MGENSLGAVIFAAVAAGLLICFVWKTMWELSRDEDDDVDHGRGGNGGGGGGNGGGGGDSGHISFAASDDGSDGHISFVVTDDDDEESGGGHIVVSRSNSDHICMSRSTSSSSGYCISDFHASGVATDYQLTPRDHRATV